MSQPVEQWKKDRCRWCAEGIRTAGAPLHRPRPRYIDVTCTANADEYIAELEAKLREAEAKRERAERQAAELGDSLRRWRDKALPLWPLSLHPDHEDHRQINRLADALREELSLDKK